MAAWRASTSSTLAAPRRASSAAPSASSAASSRCSAGRSCRPARCAAGPRRAVPARRRRQQQLPVDLQFAAVQQRPRARLQSVRQPRGHGLQLGAQAGPLAFDPAQSLQIGVRHFDANHLGLERRSLGNQFIRRFQRAIQALRVGVQLAQLLFQVAPIGLRLRRRQPAAPRRRRRVARRVVAARAPAAPDWRRRSAAACACCSSVRSSASSCWSRPTRSATGPGCWRPAPARGASLPASRARAPGPPGACAPRRPALPAPSRARLAAPAHVPGARRPAGRRPRPTAPWRASVIARRPRARQRLIGILNTPLGLPLRASSSAPRSADTRSNSLSPSPAASSPDRRVSAFADGPGRGQPAR